MTDAWPWLTYAGLGAFHGLNPAMGWLFAVALGLQRRSRAIVMASLLPIAIGHATSIAVVAGLLVIASVIIPHDLVRLGSGLLLLAWAAYHWRFAHRHRVRFGMQVGLLGLAVWSFLMATAQRCRSHALASPYGILHGNDFERGGLRPIPDSASRRWDPHLGDAHHHCLGCSACL